MKMWMRDTVKPWSCDMLFIRLLLPFDHVICNISLFKDCFTVNLKLSDVVFSRIFGKLTLLL